MCIYFFTSYVFIAFFSIDFNSLSRILHSILVIHDSDQNSITHLPISNHYNVLLTLATANATQIHSTLVSSYDGKNLQRIHFKFFKQINNFNSRVKNVYLLGNFVAFSKKFERVSDLSISSQVIYLGNGHIKANYDTDTKNFSLNEEKVVSLINILEPRLGMNENSKNKT
jgi:hypothetical protein